MKHLKMAGRVLSLVLIMTLLISIVPFASADSVPADVDELMELFDDRVSAPKEKSLLSETETMVVQSKNGNSIYVLAKPGGGKKLYTAPEGAEVTVYARESGYSLGIVKGKAIGGWMNNQYLAAAAYATDSAAPTASADKKDAGALVTLGRSYELGDGEKQDYAKAEECYKQAIDLGSTEAMTCLARLYCKNDIGYIAGSMFEGNLDPPLGDDHSGKVVELLKKAAEKGDADALYLLAAVFYDNESYYSYSMDPLEQMYGYDLSFLAGYDELDIWNDVEKAKGSNLALEYYLKAYEKGSAAAAMRLDEYYYNALSDKGGSKEALSLLKDRINKNDSFAMFLYAVYSEDEGKSADAEKYFALAEKTAVKQNDPVTLALLAESKYDPDRKDNSDAFALLRKAADAGGIGAVVRVLMCGYAGEDLNKEVYDLVIDKGNADELLYLGGLLHEAGGLEVLPATYAAESCLRAAEKGNIGALLEMSCILIDLEMTDPADWPKGGPERAFKVIKAAAEKNIFPWMCDGGYTIVWMYQNGFGCAKDEKEAQKWLDYMASIGLDVEYDSFP